MSGADGLALSEQEILRGAEAATGGKRPAVMLSSWSPPARLKSNKDARNGGTLRTVDGGYDYAGFAQWWADSVRAYRAVGIMPQYVTLQNEPNWKADWETCLFRPQEEAGFAGYDKALVATSDAFQALPDPPRILGAETLGISSGDPETYLPPTNPDLIRRVYGVAHHLYNGGTHTDPDSFTPRLREIRNAYPDLPKFQTEFGRSDGFQTAWLIHNSLVEENASAYIYWAGVWNDSDCLITMENPWSRATWKTAQGFTLNDRYDALWHYAAFTEPGDVRVEATPVPPALRGSAFLSADGKRLTVITLNTSEKQTVTLAVQGAGFRVAQVYRTQFGTTERRRIQTAGTLAQPPHSLTTWVLRR
jgi:glucuronoarabinoxylan endo-1,4-beta-xylanase